MGPSVGHYGVNGNGVLGVTYGKLIEDVAAKGARRARRGRRHFSADREGLSEEVGDDVGGRLAAEDVMGELVVGDDCGDAAGGRCGDVQEVLVGLGEIPVYLLGGAEPPIWIIEPFGEEG